MKVKSGTSVQRHRAFEFNLRELAGSMGDFGTLFPLAIGYIAVNGLNPAGLFIMLGLTNIALGLIYRLPMPLQPKKVIAVAAIAQRWPPSMVYASGFGLGILWFVLVLTGMLRKIVAITPTFIVRGIQLALGITLGWQALKMMAPAPLLGLLTVAIALLLRENRYAPAALVLMALGVGIVAWQGRLPAAWDLTLTLPPLTLPRLSDVWQAMLLAGFAQVPLSITNAVIATAALIGDYFPDKAVSERKLMLNMGVMNVVASLFGGMPMCHGAGGLAGQYYFGARTGGTPILEGLIEVSIGLFLSRSIANVMAAFPMALVGGMMFLVGIQLGKGAVKLRGWKLALCLVTVGLSVAVNMAVGFLVGLALAYGVRALKRRRALPCLCAAKEVACHG
ncbi:MAG: putative sulfate/molybdate transporter [Anaerolineae bacterium]|nr:putative sulfate/molybdate transporter [Anaerolineae bacterium]